MDDIGFHDKCVCVCVHPFFNPTTSEERAPDVYSSSGMPSLIRGFYIRPKLAPVQSRCHHYFVDVTNTSTILNFDDPSKI